MKSNVTTYLQQIEHLRTLQADTTKITDLEAVIDDLQSENEQLRDKIKDLED